MRYETNTQNCWIPEPLPLEHDKTCGNLFIVQQTVSSTVFWSETAMKCPQK